MEVRPHGALCVMLRSSDLVFEPRQSNCLQNHSNHLLCDRKNRTGETQNLLVIQSSFVP